MNIRIYLFYFTLVLLLTGIVSSCSNLPEEETTFTGTIYQVINTTPTVNLELSTTAYVRITETDVNTRTDTMGKYTLKLKSPFMLGFRETKEYLVEGSKPGLNPAAVKVWVRTGGTANVPDIVLSPVK